MERDWTGRNGLSRQRRGTRFYITDEQQAGGGRLDARAPIGPSPLPLTLVSFRGTSFERDTEREREREREGGRRWSGEASRSAERSDANGWMGREAGAELMRWRAHSMGVVGARAASHRAPPPSAEALPNHLAHLCSR